MMNERLTLKSSVKCIKPALFIFTAVIVFLFIKKRAAFAAGLVDDTVSEGNLYSKYPLSNYQLDFYVDNSWSWLPWNWLEGIGKSVQYGLYCITDFIWTISLYLSSAAGYVVQEAYRLDFLNDMAQSIGKSMQAIAGISPSGFLGTGFYAGFMLMLILVIGIYVAYTGLIKRETSRAIHAVVNFLVIFILSASFIAYSPDYIQKVNDFSGDISRASLELGTKITIGDSDSTGGDSVDMIRNDLFSIQVQKPWLLLQFGNSDIDEIGEDRIEALLSKAPSDDDGKTREEAVKSEIEDNDNDNLTIPMVIKRLGMVFFLFIFNIGITVFIFLLTGIMLFSQILFIIYAIFLPVSFLLSMIPGYEGMAKQAIMRVFNTIMMRAGITLVVTAAFCISGMLYGISSNYPFFMIAFLQIICFAGIYMKLGDILGMFSLNAADSQGISRKIMHKPYSLARKGFKSIQRRAARAVISKEKALQKENTMSGKGKRTQGSDHLRDNKAYEASNNSDEKKSYKNTDHTVKNGSGKQEVRENVQSVGESFHTVYAHTDSSEVDSSTSHIRNSHYVNRDEVSRLQGSEKNSLSESSYNAWSFNNGSVESAKERIEENDNIEAIRERRLLVTMKDSKNTIADGSAAENRSDKTAAVKHDNVKADISAGKYENLVGQAVRGKIMKTAELKERENMKPSGVTNNKINRADVASKEPENARSSESTVGSRVIKNDTKADKRGNVKSVKQAADSKSYRDVTANDKNDAKADRTTAEVRYDKTATVARARENVRSDGSVFDNKVERNASANERSNVKIADSVSENKIDKASLAVTASENQKAAMPSRTTRPKDISDIKNYDADNNAAVRNSKIPVTTVRERRTLRDVGRTLAKNDKFAALGEYIVRTENTHVIQEKTVHGSLTEKSKADRSQTNNLKKDNKKQKYKRGNIFKKSFKKKGRRK